MNISPSAAPWTHIKTDRDRAAVGVRMGLNLVHQFAHLTWPVMPVMARKIHEAIQPIAGGPRSYSLAGSAHGRRRWTSWSRGTSRSIRPTLLFAKIRDEQVAEWKAAVWRVDVRRALASGRRLGLRSRAEPLPAIGAQGFQRREARLVVHLFGIAHPIAQIDIRQAARLAPPRHDPGSCRCPGCAHLRRDGKRNRPSKARRAAHR